MYDPGQQLSLTAGGRPAIDVHLADVTLKTATAEASDQSEATIDAQLAGMTTLVTETSEARDQSEATALGASSDVTMLTKTYEARDASEGAALFAGTLRTDADNPEQSDPNDFGWA